MKEPPPRTATPFFSFFLVHLPGHGRTAGKEFQIKIPHDAGAQDIFI